MGGGRCANKMKKIYILEGKKGVWSLFLKEFLENIKKLRFFIGSICPPPQYNWRFSI